MVTIIPPAHDSETAALDLWGADLLERASALDPAQELDPDMASEIRSAYSSAGLYMRRESEGRVSA